MSRSLLDLQRAPPATLAKWMVEDGVFQDLQGQPCSNCFARQRSGGFSSSHKLGRLTGQNLLALDKEATVENVSTDTACYRCLKCRTRFSVVHGHPLLETLGHGGLSPSLAVFAWWCYLEDVSLTATARLLNLSEPAVRRLFDLAALVCAEDAVQKQSAISSGGRRFADHRGRSRRDLLRLLDSEWRDSCRER